MTSATLRMSPTAARDIEDVLRYTFSEFGERKHAEYQTLIRTALNDIRIGPTAHPAKHRSDLGEKFYTFQIGRRGWRAIHHFLYRMAADNYVEILRLLHNGMDDSLHLPD